MGAKDCKLYKIGAGTSEVRRLVIGCALNSKSLCFSAVSNVTEIVNKDLATFSGRQCRRR